MSKNVKFTKKVISKTTVSTCPTVPGKSILKKSETKYKVGPDGRYLSGPNKGFRAVSLKSRFGTVEDCLDQASAAPPCEPTPQPARVAPPREKFIPPRPPYTQDEIDHREFHRQATHTLHKLRIPVHGKRWGEKVGQVPVCPVIREDEELEAMWNLPRDRGQCHYKLPEEPQPPPEEWLNTHGCPDYIEPPEDFSRYAKFLENYAPDLGDMFPEPTAAPPCSPEPVPDVPDMIDWGEDVAAPQDMLYGPSDPMQEFACDPQFFPRAAAMAEGGLMDFMPQMGAGLPAPMMPSSYQPPGYGPSAAGFRQPMSKKRHKMVGWGEPVVRLFRSDLPPTSPFVPYERDEIGYQTMECDDLIGLHSPPPAPSLADLSALRYTPPPASPPDRPYSGMWEDDLASIEALSDYQSPQYSPTRLPVHYGQSFPPAYSPPDPPPPLPFPYPCTPSPPASPEQFYGPVYEPPRTSGLMEWLSTVMPSAADPFYIPPPSPRPPSPRPPSPRPPSPHTSGPSPCRSPRPPSPHTSPCRPQRPPTPECHPESYITGLMPDRPYSPPQPRLRVPTPPQQPQLRVPTPPQATPARPCSPSPKGTPTPRAPSPRAPSPRAPSPCGVMSPLAQPLSPPPAAAPCPPPKKKPPLRRKPAPPPSAEAEARRARAAEARKKMMADRAKNRKDTGGDFEVQFC